MIQFDQGIVFEIACFTLDHHLEGATDPPREKPFNSCVVAIMKHTVKKIVADANARVRFSLVTSLVSSMINTRLILIRSLLPLTLSVPLAAAITNHVYATQPRLSTGHD